MNKVRRRERRREAQVRRRQHAAEGGFEWREAPLDESVAPPAVAIDQPRPAFYLNQLERLGGLFTAPARTLGLVLDEEDWPVPVTLYFVVIALMTARAVGSGALHGAANVAEFLGTMPQLLLVSTALQIALPWSLQSALLLGVARRFGQTHSFVATFAVVGYARLPMLLAALLTTFFSALGDRGEAVARFLALGLGAFVDAESMGSSLTPLLAALNLPNLCGLLLMTLAVEQLCACERRKAALIAGGYAVLTLGVQFLLTMTGPPR